MPLFKWKHVVRPETTSDQGHIRIADLKKTLTDILDTQILSRFTAYPGTMAEILLTTTSGQKALTIALRPDDSVGLHVLPRNGETILGRCLASGRHFVGSLRTDQGEIPHLLSTKSVLTLPILGTHRRIVGLLNIESVTENALSEKELQDIQQSGVLQQISQALATGPSLTDEAARSQLIDDTEDSIYTITSPTQTEAAYHQIIQIARQLIDHPDISGGLLLRREIPNIARDAESSGVEDRIAVVARLGDFNPPQSEWDLRVKSITSRAIARRETQLVPRIDQDGDYYFSGERFAHGSEIITPLPGGDKPIGVIDLLSPKPSTFSTQDADLLERLAKIIVQVVNRLNEIIAAERSRQQLEYAIQNQNFVMQLFGNTALDLAGMRTVKERALHDLLEHACKHTESDLGMVVLDAQTKDRQLVVQQYVGPGAKPNPPRFLPDQRIYIGRAFQTGQPQFEGDVTDISGFMQANPAFPMHSVLAVPLKRGEQIIGVLNVEAARAHHYTTEHMRWMGFIAEQMVNALVAVALAEEDYRDNETGKLEKSVDASILELRKLSIEELRAERDKILRRIINTICALTGADYGRLLLAINVIRDPNADVAAQESIDEVNGEFIHLIDPSIPPDEEGNRHFNITRGISGKVFREQRRLVFNTFDERPEDFTFDPGEPQTINAGLYIPVFEGTTRIGVLNFESEQEGVFTQEIVQVGWKAAGMLSKVIGATRLRLRQLQSATLRGFEIEILRNQAIAVADYMKKVMEFAAKLTETNEGWAQLIQIRHASERLPQTARIEGVYSGKLENGKLIWQADVPPYLNVSGQNDPLISDFPLYLEVVRSQLPYIILDTKDNEQRPELAQSLPWPQAQSAICVPLVRPLDSAGEAKTEIYGALLLAAGSRCQFSDPDKSILSLFTETVNLGLRNLALYDARRQFMQEVNHLLTKAISPIELLAGRIPKLLAGAAHQDLQTINRINKQIEQVNDLTVLLTQFVSWFYILSDIKSPPDERNSTINVTSIIDDMEQPIGALAKMLTGQEVHWPQSVDHMHFSGGGKRQAMVEAALFNYIDNALKYGPTDDVQVFIEEKGKMILFTVRSTGKQLEPEERERIFDLYFRGSNIDATATGNGIGLYQVRDIAQRLGGRAWYQPAGNNFNDFILSVPTSPASGLIEEESW